MEGTNQSTGMNREDSERATKLLEFLQSCRFGKDEVQQYFELFRKNKVDYDLLLQLYEEDALLVDLLKNQLSLLPGDLIRIKLGIKAIHTRSKAENNVQSNLNRNESTNPEYQRATRGGKKLFIDIMCDLLPVFEM